MVSAIPTRVPILSRSLVNEEGADGDSEGVGDDNQSRTGFLGDCQHLGRVKLDLACAQLNQGKSQGGEVCT